MPPNARERPPDEHLPSRQGAGGRGRAGGDELEVHNGEGALSHGAAASCCCGSPQPLTGAGVWRAGGGGRGGSLGRAEQQQDPGLDPDDLFSLFSVSGSLGGQAGLPRTTTQPLASACRLYQVAHSFARWLQADALQSKGVGTRGRRQSLASQSLSLAQSVSLAGRPAAPGAALTAAVLCMLRLGRASFAALQRCRTV